MLRPYKGDLRFWSSARKRKDQEVVFAGGDHTEEAPVRGDSEFAERQVVKKRHGRRLHDGGRFFGGRGGERREIDPNEVAGFFFRGAFEENAIFIWRPLECAEADANARNAIGNSEVADFQDFIVDVVRAEFSARGNGKTAGEALKRGEFLIRVQGEVEMLKARRTGQIAVTFDGEGLIHARKPGRVEKSAAFENGAGTLDSIGKCKHAEKQARLQRFLEKGHGGAVGQPARMRRFKKEILAVSEFEQLAGVFEDQGHLRVAGGAAVVGNHGDKKLGKDGVAVGREVESIDAVTEKRIAVDEFFALQNAAALAVGILKPDIVPLQIVLFGFQKLANGINDAAIGAEGEGGDVFVDGMQRLFQVDILSVRWRNRKVSDDGAKKCANLPERAETSARAGTDHGLG